MAACSSPRKHRLSDFSDECPAFAAMRQQLAGLIGIPGGLKLDDLDLEIRNRRG